MKSLHYFEHPLEIHGVPFFKEKKELRRLPDEISLAGLGAAQIGDKFWPDIASTYGLTKSTIVNFRDSPMDDMSAFIKNDIPTIMVYGTADTVVVYEENGKLLEGYYNEKGGTLKVIAKPGCDHHPHGLPDPTPIIDFVEQNYKD